MATPLDPLLKHLKKVHAASAGPKDVLGAISKERMDRWLSSNDDDGRSNSCYERDFVMRDAVAVDLRVEQRDYVSNGRDDNSNGFVLRQQQQQLQQQQHLPMAAVGGMMQIQQPFLQQQQQQQQQQQNSSLIDVLIPPAKPAKRPERCMPDFCYASQTHVDNLLRTMPHLRHLSNGSTDMSGLGLSESKNILHKLLTTTTQSYTNASSDSTLDTNVDYNTSILRQHANRRASLELASFLKTLSNEMPHDKFITVESEVYSKLFSLVHSKSDHSERLAGIAALDALLTVPSFDQDKKTIRFGNNLSNGLKAPTNADYESLHAISRALGKMAASAANVDRVEFEIGRSLEWLRSDKGDHRRLAAVLVLCELARMAPTAFYSKTQQSKPLVEGAVKDAGLLAGLGDLGLGGSNEFLDNIFPVLRDRQLIVRVCAADALSECIKILMERQPESMTAHLCKLFSEMMQGLIAFDPCDDMKSGEKPFNFQSKSNIGRDITAAINAHGSLLAVGTFLDHSGDFIMPRELIIASFWLFLMICGLIWLFLPPSQALMKSVRQY